MDRRMATGLAFVIAALTSLVCRTHAVPDFTSKLQELVDDGLAFTQFQDYVNSGADITYTNTPVDGQLALDAISEKLENKFRLRIEALKRLQTVIQNAYNKADGTDSTAQHKRCCTTHPSEENPRFKGKVDGSTMCVAGDGLTKGASKFLKDDVLAVMRENQRVLPALKWQYYSSEEGVLFTYPALHFCEGSPPYDPRFRPFYVQAVTPVVKDVVVIIDKSGSMTATTDDDRSLMAIAAEAASTVITTLNPNDRFGMVEFSGEAVSPPGNADNGDCYGTQLAMATPKNVKYITDTYLKNIRPTGATNYGNALKKGFAFFSDTPDVKNDKRSREKVVLFLTDGRPNDARDSILQTLREENKKLNNQVIIFTFALGTTIDVPGVDTLKAMANQKTADPEAGEIKEGRFVRVTDAHNLRSAMARYYDYFSKSGSAPEPVFTVPYFGFFGLGVLMSTCIRVTTSSLIGVVCVDMTMADLVSDVTYYNQGRQSYAFLLDGQARVFMHPLLPQPQDIDASPVFMQLDVLEPNLNSAAKLDMIAGKSGSTLSQAIIVTSRGFVLLDGVNFQVAADSKYLWKKVARTQLTVCVVVVKGALQSSSEWTGPQLTTDHFIYHRIDLADNLPGVKCSFFDRIVLKGRSGVKLTEEAFENAFEYQDSLETKNDVDRYTLIMNNYAPRTGTTLLKKGVRETVHMTYKLELLFNTQQTYAAWSYIGTEDGVFRTLPAHVMAKEYNHRRRPWYLKAIANPSLATMSTPYKDASSGSYIITLSRALMNGPLPLGVVGWDFTFVHFYQMIVNVIRECSDEDKRCFIIDKSGFIVVHRDFVESRSDESFQNIHVTDKEPSVAAHLIQNSILRKTTCIEIEQSLDQYFWTMAGGLTARDFTMYEIKKSNIFLVIADGRHPPGATDSCHRCGPLSSSHISSCSGKKCECPCYTNHRNQIYNFCKDEYSLSSDAPPPCTPREPVLVLTDLVKKEASEVSALDQCYDFNCPERDTYSKCAAIAGCRWCEDSTCTDSVCKVTSSCARLPAPTNGTKDDDGSASGDVVTFTCNDGFRLTGSARRTCLASGTWDGTVADCERNEGEAAEAKSSSAGLIVGIIVGVIAVVVVVVVVVVLVVRHKRRQGGSSSSEAPAAEYNNAALHGDRPAPTAPDFLHHRNAAPPAYSA